MSVVIASLATDVGKVSFSHSAPPGTWPPVVTHWTQGKRFAFATVAGTVVSRAAFQNSARTLWMDQAFFSFQEKKVTSTNYIYFKELSKELSMLSIY